MACSVIINGLPCRAWPLRDRPYCYNHHRYGATKARSATLVDLWRLAEEFDERSREVGELYPAAEFVAWLKPDLDGLEG
jgi:hypothetical protein